MQFKAWLNTQITENTRLKDWLLTESSARYSIEVNFRTKPDEVIDSFVKICLGFVSAAMKQSGFHIKHVYDQKPIRILVSSRNWDDGEWVGLVHYHPDHDGGCFIVSKGFYNKDRKTMSVQNSKKCAGDSAAEVTKELKELMHSLKNSPDRHQEKLKPVKMKRGPKK